jgi:hypothetical protein
VPRGDVLGIAPEFVDPMQTVSDESVADNALTTSDLGDSRRRRGGDLHFIRHKDLMSPTFHVRYLSAPRALTMSNHTVYCVQS